MTTIGPFSIVQQETMTECQCPPSLCRHQPDGYRFEYDWIVWDDELNEHASLAHRDGGFADFYERKRDAVAAARRYVAGLTVIRNSQPALAFFRDTANQHKVQP